MGVILERGRNVDGGEVVRIVFSGFLFFIVVMVGVVVNGLFFSYPALVDLHQIVVLDAVFLNP